MCASCLINNDVCDLALLKLVGASHLIPWRTMLNISVKYPLSPTPMWCYLCCSIEKRKSETLCWEQTDTINRQADTQRRIHTVAHRQTHWYKKLSASIQLIQQKDRRWKTQGIWSRKFKSGLSVGSSAFFFCNVIPIHC